MFTTRTLAFAAVGLAALFVGSGAAQPQKKDQPMSDSLPIPPESEAMKEKRVRAHAMLDALTAGDMDALRRNAEVMSAIADMRVFASAYKTPEYRYQAQVFKHAADDMLKAAKEKNRDAATNAYTEMVHTCVKCHTHFRGVKK
jgi:hypothetical protein